MAKNTNVISPENSQAHVIDSYHFKVISEFTNPDLTQTNAQAQAKVQTENIEPAEVKQPEEKPEKEDPKELSVFQSGFVEDLLKKTDEMSGNLIKLQMQIESQENEFNNRLNAELENAKEKFSQDGYNQAKIEFDQKYAELEEKFLKSVAKLDEACANLEIFIAKNEKELASTAIEIAKEVIHKELEQNSAQIALNLSKELINELQGASSIELKVSPSDYDFIKSHLKELDHLKISLDDAISKGSVLVLSDEANIESNLNARLMKIKKMVSE